MKIILYFIVAFFSIYFVYTATAADSSMATVRVVDDYLTSIKSIESRFIQTDANGGRRDGVMYIKKPNRIRIEYFSPDKELILMNSSLVMHYVQDLDETNYVSGEELAMALLSQKNFRITKQAKIERFEITGKHIEVDFRIKNDKQKRITSLQLSNNPIRLKAISIIQNDDFIKMDFIEPVINHSISDSMFEFENKQIGID